MKETGQVYSPESRDLNLDEEDESPDIKGNILDFVLPIGVLIALTIVTGELFLALIAAIAVCFLLYIPRKKMTAARFCDLAMHGFCNMIPTVAIIFFVFVMQQGMTDIGIASYVIDAVRPVISPVLLPAITFLLVAALNFATGSTWGIPALVSPIILPLALSIGVNPLVVMGAIVSGATPVSYTHLTDGWHLSVYKGQKKRRDSGAFSFHHLIGCRKASRLTALLQGRPSIKYQ